MRTAALLALLLVTLAPATSCKKAENAAAQERLSKPEPPDPLNAQLREVLLAGNLEGDEKLRDRVSRMSFAEAARRLGSLKLDAEGELAFTRAGLKVNSKESVVVVQAPEGDFSVKSVSGDGSLQELVFANGVLFLKNNNGKWRASRDPVGERNELREDSAGIWRSFYDLFAHATQVKSVGSTTHHGRTAVKYQLIVANQEAEAKELGRGEAPPPRRTDQDAGPSARDAGPAVDEAGMQQWVSKRVRAWRKKARPGGGMGELIVDQETGVILFVKFDGRLVVGDQKEPAELTVKLTHDVSEVGKPHEIVVPKDAIDEVVRKKWPVKPRELLEEEGLVEPLPKEEEGKKPAGERPR